MQENKFSLLLFFLPGKKIPLISRINTSGPSYDSVQETYFLI